MTPEAQRIAIAEACGFRVTQTASEDWRYVMPSGGYGPLPDYLNSLDAVHEAEKVLTDEQWPIFKQHLREAVFYDYERDQNRGAWRRDESATAPQRCEALLRVLGKWEEGR